MSRDQARLQCRGIGTLVLPWWPSDVTVSRQGRWVEQARPGDWPVWLAGNLKSQERRVSYLLREADNRPVTEHLYLLDLMMDATAPVRFWLGRRFAGLNRITDVSRVELRHDSSGQPIACDMAFTLVPASTADVTVGPVRKRTRNG